MDKSNTYILSDSIIEKKDGDCGDLIDNSIEIFSKIFKNLSCSVYIKQDNKYIHLKQLNLVLYGDNSFYSFRNINDFENNFENLNKMNKTFDKYKKVDITQKTGLGSSSAFSVCISSVFYLVSEILPF